MLPSSAEAARFFRGAWRLFRFDREGFAHFGNTIDAFWQSFWCAVYVAPLWAMGLILRGARRSDVAPGASPDDLDRLADALPRIVAVETIAYVAAWFAFPLAMAYIVRLLGREDRYFGYFAAYNWTIAPQVALTVVAALLLATGLFPGALGTMIDLAAMGYGFGVLWFLARHGLDLPPGTAALVVAIDVLLNQLVFGIGWLILRG
ncbi:MAG: hypothetical protein JNM30_10850 [Rhodospirillales bacterium]|nr:hypothetical protein [Rhodospirillales bacterium]